MLRRYGHDSIRWTSEDRAIEDALSPYGVQVTSLPITAGQIVSRTR